MTFLRGSETWSAPILARMLQTFWFGLCCSSQLSPGVVWSFLLLIQPMLLSVGFLICYASRAVRRPQSFPQSVVIMPPLTCLTVSLTLLFPKWPFTPAMTLFTKLSRASAVIGPASGNSTLTSVLIGYLGLSYQSEEAMEPQDML